MTSSFKIISPLLLLLIAFTSTFCTNSDHKYDIANFYTAQAQDSLKADIITYVGRKPKNLPALSRFDPKYRPYYVKYLPQYHFDRYFISEDSTHYFYMLRPARSAKGNVQRGVGGKFRKNERGVITDFEEVYNTPILEEEELKEKGRQLFDEMVKTGSIQKFATNRQYIEWPDNRLTYDKAIFEWTYTPVNQSAQ